MGSRRNWALKNEQSLTNGHFQRVRFLGRARYWTFVVQGLVTVVIGSNGCSGTPSTVTCNGNGVAGATGTDPCATGGAPTVGGATAVGGTANTGGAAQTGGTVSTGGTADTGGTVGTPSTGGSDSSGGAAPTGGSLSTGGSTEAGGSATGGTTDAGGTVSTGGIVSTGGAMPTGGSMSTGGMTATGGAGGTGGPPQPILQYNFEEGSGTTAQDSTTNHNDGSLTSVAWSASSRNGGSVSYALADSVIAAPSGLFASTHALTVSAWVNLTAASAAESTLFYFGGSGTYLTLVLNNSLTPAGISLRFQGPTGAERVLTTPTQLPAAVWKHITVTVSSAGSAIYVDGKIAVRDKALAIDPSTLGATTSNLVGNSPTSNQAFQGKLDEFYVYDGVLPLSNIRTLAWPKSDYSIYHFEEGAGTTVQDSSDRAINGTLVGGATWVVSPFGTGAKLTNTTTAPAQQYVDLADGIVSACGTNSTFAGWVSLETNNPNARFLDFGNDATHYVSITTRYQVTGQDTPCLQLQFLYPTTRTVRAPYTWIVGTWYHIAVVRNATDALGGNWIRLYVNGLMVGNGAISTGTVFGSTINNYFGKSAIDTYAGLNGSIDEILVSCRAYTDDEIKQLAYLPLGGA